MKIWKYSRLDALMLALSIAQFVTTLLLAVNWKRMSTLGRAGSFTLLVAMMVYNIIIVSHLFTHTPWFNSPRLNRLASMLNSINIGQSVQAYQLTHVRNHHRYNNDRQPNGNSKDLSSTFRGTTDGEHRGVFQYAVFGAVETFVSTGRALLSITRLWRVGAHEHELLSLVKNSSVIRAAELRQVQLDRMVHFLSLCLFLAISWQWFLFCYLPAFFVALALVNVQNYYEHYGALPENLYANSVSYYGRVYNFLTFNDGFHQEHHLRPLTHWTQMPRVHQAFSQQLNESERIISPVPAIIGFFHRNRKLLHRGPVAAVRPVEPDSNTFSPVH